MKRRAALLWPAVAALTLGSAMAQETGKDAKADAGQLLFNNRCRTCHSLKPDDNRLGPNLHGIVGRKVGSLKDYGYSSAMKQADLVWDAGTLDRFLARPDEVVPGNSMRPFGGVPDAEERARIIAHLRTK